MGLKLTHNPSGTTIELSKEPDLPLNLGRSENQDVMVTDSGKQKIFTRRVSLNRFSLILRLLNHYDRKLLEQFYKETVFGRRELFDIEIQIDHEEPLQVGATQDGNPITVGTSLDADCGNPGGPILVGDWVRQDRYIFVNCRFDQDELRFTDDLPYNSTTDIQLIQELG